MLKKSDVYPNTIIDAVSDRIYTDLYERYNTAFTLSDEYMMMTLIKEVREDYDRLLNVLIQCVDTIPDDRIYDVVRIYYHLSTDIFSEEKIYTYEQLDILLKKKYMFDETVDTVDFYNMLYAMVINSVSEELFERFLKFYDEKLVEKDRYRYIYKQLLKISNRQVYKHFKKILLEYYNPEENRQETIDFIVDNIYSVDIYNAFKELKKLGYKPVNKHYTVYINTMMKIYTLKELKNSGIVYNVDGIIQHISYTDVLQIYMLNRADYKDNIEDFYKDIEMLTKQDYRYYEIENNVLIDVVNDSITNIVIEYTDNDIDNQKDDGEDVEYSDSDQEYIKYCSNLDEDIRVEC